MARETGAARDREQMERYSRLKRALVEYATEGPLLPEWVAMLAENGMPEDEHTTTLYTDMFLTSEDLHRGRTVIGHFLNDQQGLSETDRDLLRSWEGGAVAQVYEIIGADGSSLLLRGTADELDYRAEVTTGARMAKRLAKAAFVFARLLPVGHLWVLSGSQVQFTADQEEQALGLAANWAARMPKVVFRNPAFLDRAWELQRADREKFIAFFGSDLVVLPVDEAPDRVAEYWQWRTGAEGQDGVAPVGGYFWFDDEDLVDVETVAMIYDEREGLMYEPNYQRLLDVFANPAMIRRRAGRHVVEDYLHDDDASPLRRAAQAHPEGASRIFAHLLRRKDFSWEADGEALLRQYKPDAFAAVPLPRQVPLNDRLAAAYRRAKAAQND